MIGAHRAGREARWVCVRLAAPSSVRAPAAAIARGYQPGDRRGGGTDGPPYGMPIAPTDSPQDLC